MDSPDPSKTQSTVGTVLSIYTAPRQPGPKNTSMAAIAASNDQSLCWHSATYEYCRPETRELKIGLIEERWAGRLSLSRVRATRLWVVPFLSCAAVFCRAELPIDAALAALVAYNLILALLCIAFMARRVNTDIFSWLSSSLFHRPKLVRSIS